MADAEGVPEIRKLPIEDIGELPECRALAGWDVAGAIRFEMDHAYAEQVLEQLRSAREDPRDGFVDLIIQPLDYPAYASLTKGLAELHSSHENDEVAIKQVIVTPDQQDLALTVLVNASQIESSMKKNYVAIKQYGKNRLFGQRFGLSKNGAAILEQQLEAALDGVEDPLAAVEVDDVE